MIWNKTAPNVAAVMTLNAESALESSMETNIQKHQFSGHHNWTPILISKSKTKKKSESNSLRNAKMVHHGQQIQINLTCKSKVVFRRISSTVSIACAMAQITHVIIRHTSIILGAQSSWHTWLGEVLSSCTNGVTSIAANPAIGNEKC